MANIFIKIYTFFQKQKFLLFTILLLIIGLCLFSIKNLNIEEDISNFLPKNDSEKNILEIYQNNTAANKIFLFIQNNDSVLSTYDIVTELSDYLQTKDTLHHIKNIISEINQEKINEITDFITENMPFYLSDDDYLRIDSLISLQNIEYQLNTNKQLLLSPAASFFKNIIIKDPLFFLNSTFNKLQDLQANNNFQNEDGFIFNKEGEAVIILSSNYESSETKNNSLLAKDIQNACNFITEKYDNQVEISSFGAALISVTNANQIKSDSLWTGIVAMIIILLVLFYFFRNFKDILFIGISIIFGFLFSLGIILFFKTTISIIIIGIASVIVGIAINYPIHLLAHYKQEPDKLKTIREIVVPLLIGNITTVAAFLCLIFVSSDSMKDFGLFASLLLIGTIIFVLIFLPHFLKVKKFYSTNLQQDTINNEKNFAFKKIANFSPDKNKWIVLSVVVLSIVFFIFSFGTSFEADLHSINYMTAEQTERMQKMSENISDTLKTVFLVAEAENSETALQNNELVINKIWNNTEENILDKQHKIIMHKSGIDHFILSEKLQLQKIEKWNNFWKDRRNVFIKNFKTISKQLNFNNNAFNKFYSILEHNYESKSLEEFVPILENFGENYISVKNNKTTILTLLTINKNDTEYIENQIKNINNKNIFTFANDSFYKQIVNSLQKDFNYILFVCGFVVFIFLLISFGRIELCIIAFIPLTVAWIWILGIMNIFDIRFNIINIILATFIFGQGDDYTIFVTEGLVYEYSYGKKFLASFKNSILLSSIIMLVAIGMLIFAKHPALKSLAEVTIVGMSAVLVMAYIFPPLIFRFITQKKGKQRLMPITLWNLVKTVICSLGFLIGIIYMTIVGFFLLVIGKKSKKHKEKYHIIMCNFFQFLAKILIQVKITKRNTHNENFDKPSIIISNHQSHLDLLFTLFLSPKIIALTNNWVWNNPIYGLIIRWADFISINENIEENMEKIKTKISEGYSILIFPEGTRSEDCSILRFHKGAFEIAEQLRLDIIPVVIHGVGHIFPKTEFIIRKGSVMVNILERITPENQMRQGKTTLDITKNFRNFYKTEYKKLQKELETIDYYKDLVYKNYIYKGIEIQQQAKKILKNNNLLKQISTLPDEGKLIVTNAGIGVFALLVALVKKDLEVFVVEENEDKLAIAKNCISVYENMHFVSEMQIEKNYVSINLKN